MINSALEDDEPVVVFIESNTTGTGQLIIEEAVKRGYQVVFCCADTSLYNFLDELPIVVFTVDTTQPDAVEASLKQFSNILGLICSTDSALEITAILARRLGLIGNDPRAIAVCQSKDCQYEVLSAAGIKIPRSLVIGGNGEDFTSLLATPFKFPMVAKPLRGTGSIGVRLLKTPAELNKYAESLQGARIILQEYVEGDEYSVETLTIAGETLIIGITRKHLSKPPFFVETGHDFPAMLGDACSQKIRETVVKALRAVGFTNGPAHTELRISEGDPIIIEINPRLAGGMIPVLVSISLGCDLLGHLLDFYLGRPRNAIPSDATPTSFAAIRHLCVEYRTTIGHLGLRLPDVLPNGVLACHLKSATTIVGGYGDFRDRCAYVIASGETPEQAAHLAESTLVGISSASTKRRQLETRLHNTGRLEGALDLRIQHLISSHPAEDKSETELGFYVDIDKAHLLMLVHSGILKKGPVYTLLSTLVKWRRERFSIFQGMPCPRGLYLTYEGLLSEVLGEHVGGILQTARSRNDHRATLEKLKLRRRLATLMSVLHGLTKTVLKSAALHASTPIPLFSQYQIAMPGTLGHYCLAIMANLLRSMRALQEQVSQVDVMPLGAGAGAGTSLPLMPSLSARFLGFKRGSYNSLDAVSEGDGHLRFLAELDILATLFSRVAQDFQIFSSSGLRVMEFPDALSGGSSAMPQKKNPYLLEHIKAISDNVGSELDRYRAALRKTPLGNSYEVNFVSASVWTTATSTIEAGAKLLSTLIASVHVDVIASMALLKREFATATFAAEQLVQTKGMEFRAAHHKVGCTIRERQSAQGLQKLDEIDKWLDDTETALLKLVNGGGPAPESTVAALRPMSQEFTNIMKEFRRSVRYWSEASANCDLIVANFLQTGRLDSLDAFVALCPEDACK